MTSNVSAGQQPDDSIVPRDYGSIPIASAMTIAGFSCFLASMFVLLFSSTFAPLTSSPLNGFLLRFVFLLGFACMNLLVGLSRGSWLEKRAAKLAAHVVSALALAVLAVSVVFASTFGEFPLALQIAIWTCAGAAYDLVLISWGITWNRIDADRDDNSFCATCIGCAVLLAAFVCVFMIFAPAELCAIITFVVYLLAAILQFFSSNDAGNTAENNDISSSAGFSFMHRKMVLPASAGISAGVLFAHAGLFLGVNRAFPCVIIGIALGSLVEVVLSRALGHTPLVSTVERLVFPVIGACLLVLPSLRQTATVAAVAGAGIAAAAFYLTFHWNLLVALTYRKQPKPIDCFSQGLIATTAGIALGWGLEILTTVVFGGDFSAYTIEGLVNTSELAQSALLACSCAVFALVAACAIAPFTETTPIEHLFAVQMPLDTTPNPRDLWKKACDNIAQRYNLTLREREVFEYLARGRNADHIASTLVVSTHTAKTHTSRIYRKLEINSQQQLIDITEKELDQLGHS